MFLTCKSYADQVLQQGFRHRLEYPVGMFGELIAGTMVSARGRLYNAVFKA